MPKPLNATIMHYWNMEHVGLPKFPLLGCIHQICIYESTYRSIHKHIHLHHHSWWTINFYFIFIRLLTFAPSPTRDYKLGEDFVSRESTKTIFDLSQFQRFTNQPLEGVVKTISKIRKTLQKVFHFCKILHQYKKIKHGYSIFSTDVIFRL